MDNDDQERKIIEFVSITQTEPDLAKVFLSSCDWNLSNSVRQYLRIQENILFLPSIMVNLMRLDHLFNLNLKYSKII